MENESVTLHEAMELHEILNFKTVCMMKSKVMAGMVFDQDLKALMEKDVQQSIGAIGDLQRFLTKAPTEGSVLKH